nr:integrase, catalytic region, zinc finger, CCHC-type, peptidase aspartic, catalytic [Tanacetum cinerariifolium]
MEAVVQQSSVDKQCLEIANKKLLLENNLLSQQIMSQDIVSTVMNCMSLNIDCMNVGIQRSESCEKCLNLDAEFSKSKQAYNDLLKKYSQLEKHCISLEVSMQLKQEVFQNDESCVYQNASEIPEYFEKNDLKAQLKDKDTTIYKLKDTIKSLRKNTKEEIVDKCDLATINEELENSVAKLLSENECRCKEINHVKQIFKDQFDPIKQTRVLQKEQRDSLINKLNLKSMKHEDLKAQIQDKVFVITSLRNDLRKLKGKATVDNVAQIPYATTVVPKMFKLDLKPLVPKLMHNKENNELDFACKHAKRIQELLAYVHDTCLSAIRLSEIKVARTPMNKIKKVTFVKPIASSSTNQETHDSNKPMLHSTGVKCSTSASRSKLSGNTKNNRISQPSHSNKINKLEDQPRSVKTRKNNNDRVKKVKCDDHVMQSMSNANSVSVSINNAPVKNSMNDSKSGCLCAICGKCMIAKTHHECVQFVVTNMNESKKSKSTKKHKKQNVWKPTGHVFTEVRELPDIMGYGDYQLGNVVISRVYYVEGIGHNLFSVGQFCDADMKVAFRKNTCFIRNLKGIDLLSGARDTNLYTISIDDMLKSSPICHLSKASKTKSWLWHRRLSHLNFACALGKSKKSSHQPKAEDTNQEKLYLLHMDLCGLMRVASIKGKRFMSSITAQQTNLDLELVPKENRLDIGKCNGRIPRGLTPREPTFQVILDAIALTPCYPGRSVHSMMLLSIRCINPGELLLLLSTVIYLERLVVLTSFVSRAQILWGMYYQKNVDYVELLWEDFIYEIENRVYKKQEKMYYPRFTKAIINHFLIQDKTLSWRNKIGMHTSKDDYLISTLRSVSAKESTQIYEAILLECLTSLAIKESKAYKTYLGYAIGVVPPKITRKFNKTSPSKKANDLVLIEEELVSKGKRVKRFSKKPTTTPATSIVLREAPVETQSKRKENVDVTRGKGIDLLSELHPSGSGAVVERPPKVDKITPTITSEGTGVTPGVLDVTKDESTESESESWGNDEDDSNDENDSKIEDKDEENKSIDDETPSDSEKGSNSEQDTDRSESESESDQQDDDDDEVKDDEDDDDDKSEGDEDRGMDNDDVQDKKADVGMTDAQ